MIPLLDNAALATDLDCRGKALRHIRRMLPVPEGLVSIDDPRLSGPRTLPNASVFNEHVSDSAKIQQSKLSLNGQIPTAWLSSGSSDLWAAQGNLAERVASKGAASGYAPLSSVGILLPGNVTASGNPGTVNSVVLRMPPQLSVGGLGIISGTGAFTVTWAAVPNGSWFGVNGFISLDNVLKPSFLTGQIPDGLIPSLSATKFTTGVFVVDRLPFAIGMGVGHAKGIMTDPGSTGDTRDYLGRDMGWHQFNADLPYQPYAPRPQIILASWTSDVAIVNVSTTLRGGVLFYRVTDPTFPLGSSAFIEVHPGTHDNSITLHVQIGWFVEAYVAKAGYNNSPLKSYTVTPLTDT